MSNYANKEYYLNTYKGTISEDEIEKRLEEASLHIDILTYNRIVGRGFNKLTEFQQDIIRKVTCRLADFEYENEDIIESVLTNYSINGVSMGLGNSRNISIKNGVAVKKSDYNLLSQTGLTCRNLRC